jgi:hypothetical protein
MQKQDLDPSSLQRTKALWEILLDYTNRVNHLRRDAFEYYMKIGGNNLQVYYSYKGIEFKLVNTAFINLESIAEPKELSALNEQMSYLHQTDEEALKLKWYVTRILNNANGYATAIQCIPKHLHKHIVNIFFLGDYSVDMLYVDEYYKLLEEAPLHNTILGIQ